MRRFGRLFFIFDRVVGVQADVRSWNSPSPFGWPILSTRSELLSNIWVRWKLTLTHLIESSDGLSNYRKRRRLRRGSRARKILDYSFQWNQCPNMASSPSSKNIRAAISVWQSWRDTKKSHFCTIDSETVLPKGMGLPVGAHGFYLMESIQLPF